MDRCKIIGLLAPLLLVATASTHAARIWTDANGDGLPDADSVFAGAPNDVVGVDLWIDSEGFTFANYQAWIERPAGSSFVSAEYFISGGSNFPIDGFSNPSATGLAGFGFADLSGVSRIGRLSFQLGTGEGPCATPIVDAGHPLETFSSLGTPTEYALFETSTGSCWGGTQGPDLPQPPDSLPPDEPPRREEGVVLAKFREGALVLPPTITSIAIDDALGTPGVVLSPDLQAHLAAHGVVRLTRAVPDFNPQIVDRDGVPVLDQRGAPLLVPHDLSLWYRLSLERDDVESASQQLMTHPAIRHAQPNSISSVVLEPKRHTPPSVIHPHEAKASLEAASALFPNDPLFQNKSWGLRNVAQYCGVSDFDINADTGWDLSTGNDPSVRVAILDSGIDPAHPDLPTVELGPSYISGASTSEDDLVGSWHGTACAGIVGMRGNNGIGGAGVAWNVTLTAVKVINNVGDGFETSYVNGVNWCRQQGIPIMNMSFRDYTPLPMLQEALRNARAAGIACVAAAGNENWSQPPYPVAYTRHVLGVNAFMNNGARWENTVLGCTPASGSNFASYVDLTAPGGRGIATTKKHTDGTGYYGMSNFALGSCDDWCDQQDSFGGTSAAAPYVSGVLAAILATNGSFDGEDAQRLTLYPGIVRDHTQYGVGYDVHSGWGRPDLRAVLERSLPPYYVERGTDYGGSVYNDGTGQVSIYNVPGIDDGTYAFERMRVEKTFSLECLNVPLAWTRVRGSVGWRRIEDNQIYSGPAEDAGYCEVVSLSASEMVLRSYWYRLRDPVNFGTILYEAVPAPTSGIAMSWTVVSNGGCEPTGIVGPAPHRAMALSVSPHPITNMAVISLRGFPDVAGSRLAVYNASGRLVQTLPTRVDQTVEWDLKDRSGGTVANGVYFLRLEGSRWEGATQKVVVLR